MLPVLIAIALLVFAVLQAIMTWRHLQSREATLHLATWEVPFAHKPISKADDPSTYLVVVAINLSAAAVALIGALLLGFGFIL